MSGRTDSLHLSGCSDNKPLFLRTLFENSTAAVICAGTDDGVIDFAYSPVPVILSGIHRLNPGQAARACLLWLHPDTAIHSNGLSIHIVIFN